MQWRQAAGHRAGMRAGKYARTRRAKIARKYRAERYAGALRESAKQSRRTKMARGRYGTTQKHYAGALCENF